MKKMIVLAWSMVLMLLVSSVAFATDGLSSADTAMSDTIMAILGTFLSQSMLEIVAAIFVICGVIATLLPPVLPQSSTLYTVFYKIMQFFALNFGHAKNKQDR